MASSSSNVIKLAEHKRGRAARAEDPDEYYLTPSLYDSRLDNVRAGIIHSSLSFQAIADRARLSIQTIIRLVNRTTKRPYDYTIQRIEMALEMRSSRKEDREVSRGVDLWLQDFNRKQRAKKRLRDAKRKKAKLKGYRPRKLGRRKKKKQ